MNNDMRDRFKRAREYQRKAMMELLPEGMEKHLDVIKNEMKLMITESVGRMIMERVTDRGFAGFGELTAGFGFGCINPSDKAEDEKTSENKKASADGKKKTTKIDID
ncbi:MAG: hypothetical protein J6O17_09105 [Eubacterium sp.]|nr:hypothetical protein [Eubacterium sp.]